MATPAQGVGLSMGIKFGAGTQPPWPWGASKPRKSRKTRKNDGFSEVLYGKVANFAKNFSPPDSPRPSAFFVRSMSAAFLKGGGARSWRKFFFRDRTLGQTAFSHTSQTLTHMWVTWLNAGEVPLSENLGHYHINAFREKVTGQKPPILHFFDGFYFF